MPQSHPFALTHAWWTWEHPDIRSALRRAFISHWVPIVEQAFARNFQAKAGPTDWAELVGWDRIRQDPRNIEKKAQGQYGCSDGFLLGLATTLGLPLSDFYPSNEAYLEKACSALLKGRAERADIVEYVRHRLETSAATSPHESSQNGHGRAPQSDDRAAVTTQAAVHRIATALEPILSSIDRELSERSSAHEPDHERRTGQPRPRLHVAGAGR